MTRARSALGSTAGGVSPQIVEQDGLQVLGANSPRRRDQRPNLAAPDEAAPPELDALETPGPRPAADGGRGEVDIGRSKDVGSLGERDPVG